MPQRTCIEDDCTDAVHSNDRCTKHWGRWYYAKNADRIRARRKVDRQGAQRERILAEKAAYRERNRVELAQKQREYYHANPERASAGSRTPEALKARAERKLRSRARYTELEHERRARKLALGVDSGISVQRLSERDGDRCAYCRCELTFERAERGKHIPTKATIDHVIPLSRGGAHRWSNVCLACWRCNLSKGNRLLAEWVRRPKAA